jgi:nucleotide-binding universal stress UspA family protein
MGPVVCAVDDAHASENVAVVAQQLATALGTQLVLVHVAAPVTAPGVSAAPGGQERLREDELADSKRLLESIAARVDAKDAELRSELGTAVDRILAVCAEEDAAFVVVGSRGRGNIASAMLGSVSHDVANNAPCPVVIVPTAATPPAAA